MLDQRVRWVPGIPAYQQRNKKPCSGVWPQCKFVDKLSHRKPGLQPHWISIWCIVFWQQIGAWGQRRLQIIPLFRCSILAAQLLLVWCDCRLWWLGSKAALICPSSGTYQTEVVHGGNRPTLGIIILYIYIYYCLSVIYYNMSIIYILYYIYLDYIIYIYYDIILYIYISYIISYICLFYIIYYIILYYIYIILYYIIV